MKNKFNGMLSIEPEYNGGHSWGTPGLLSMIFYSTSRLILLSISSPENNENMSENLFAPFDYAV